MTKHVKCPVCGQNTTLADNPHRPFCSERCKLIDLGAWAAEKYSIEGEEFADEGEMELWEDESGKKRTYH